MKNSRPSLEKKKRNLISKDLKGRELALAFADRSLAFNRDLSAMSSSGPLSIALDAPGGKSCGRYRGWRDYRVHILGQVPSNPGSMATTVDQFPMRFGPRPARYPSWPCISLILDDYIEAVVKSIEEGPANSQFSLNRNTYITNISTVNLPNLSIGFRVIVTEE